MHRCTGHSMKMASMSCYRHKTEGQRKFRAPVEGRSKSAASSLTGAVPQARPRGCRTACNPRRCTGGPRPSRDGSESGGRGLELEHASAQQAMAVSRAATRPNSLGAILVAYDEARGMPRSRGTKEVGGRGSALGRKGAGEAGRGLREAVRVFRVHNAGVAAGDVYRRR